MSEPDTATDTSSPPSINQPENTTNDSPATAINNDKISSDKVNLRLLLVNGKKTDILCDPTETIESIRKRIFENWPKEWAEEAPSAESYLRVLHRGRFLELSSTLEGNKIPKGETTTVHLLIKEGVPAEEPGDKCKCCIIL